ncbi:hypothetical protein SAZ11_16155 [Streptomyces sp. FXJ1.4098]|uniref:hypothetical protein n=1 Tax=Streptomyces sp. NPDC020845 TaxID=3365096 RepID=UPI00299AFD97|nr:hypothetical protein [Streptomyces sp. FXJ1.4098]
MDTKNAIKESVDALGSRLDTSHQQLSQQVADAVSLIRQDHSETRDRASAAASQASQSAVEVAALKREVNTLRRTIEDLADLVRKMPTLASSPERQVEGAVPDTEPEPPGAATTPIPAEAGADPVSEQPISPQKEEDHAGDEEEAESSKGAPVSLAGTQESPDARRDERASHRALLLHAAGVARVNVVCHRDAWDFIARRAAGHEHFGTTPTVTDHTDGLVRVTLSGRSLIGMLITLHTTEVDGRGDFDGSWALAHRFYDRIAEDLYKARREGSTPLTIVFNDGITETDTVPHDSSSTSEE